MNIAMRVAAAVQAADTDNPFTGIVPDFKVLGVEFDQTWKKLFAALWAVCIIWAGANVVLGITHINRAKDNPHERKEATSKLKYSAASLCGLLALGVIFAVIFAIF